MSTALQRTRNTRNMRRSIRLVAEPATRIEVSAANNAEGWTVAVWGSDPDDDGAQVVVAAEATGLRSALKAARRALWSCRWTWGITHTDFRADGPGRWVWVAPPAPPADNEEVIDVPF